MHFRFGKPSPRKQQPDEVQPSLFRTPRNMIFWAKRDNYVGHERPQLAFRTEIYRTNEDGSERQDGTAIFPAGRPNHRIRTVLEHYDFKADKSILRSR